MNAPLYLQHDHHHPDKKPDTAHAGLWFERFFNQYSSDWQLPKPKPNREPRRDWINTVTGSVGCDKRLKQHAERQATLLQHLQGRSQCYNTDWHFVTGMGNPHPVENGFCWHPTLGVPYLAGSAVKGLVRAWVEANDDTLPKSEKDARLENWFGTKTKDQKPEQAGGFIFFDAIPDQPPKLLCDIMTPHMGDWYSAGDKGDIHNFKAIPADWHEPVPIPFLVVKKARLIFSIAPRLPEMAAELDAVFTALTQALEWLGAGAKTAAGYGYMHEDESYRMEQKQVAEKRAETLRLAAMSPERQQIETLRQQVQANKVQEKIGGRLYASLQDLVNKTDDWPKEAKGELLALATDLLAKIEHGAKNSKAKALLNRLQ